MADAAWVALSLVRSVGGHTFRALLDHFGSPDDVLKAAPDQLRAVRGIGPVLAAAIGAVDLPRVADDLAAWQDASVRALDWNHPDYPARLRDLVDAPPTVFVRGVWPVIRRRAVAIVGTRRPTSAAAALARRLSDALARSGVTVISGLAFGIDANAHAAAIDSPAGMTVAVLGSGVLNVYPEQNHALAERVERRGALLCEVRPDAQVNVAALVARNRIISGLCDAVVIVQTDADGGALHAARFAQTQGRKVYAIDDPLGDPVACRGIAVLREVGAVMLPSDVSGVGWLRG